LSTLAAPGEKRGAFSMRVALALVFVGVFSFSAFMALSAFAPELARGDDGRSHALSRSAIGFSGAVILARARGDVVNVRRGARGQASPPLVVFTPETPPSADEVINRAYFGRLVVLPKWRAAPDMMHRGWVRRFGLYDSESLDPFFEEFAPNARIERVEGTGRPLLSYTYDEIGPSAGAVLRAGAIESLQYLAGKVFEPVVTDSEGRIVLGRIYYEDEPIFVLADPDFLNNFGLADRDTARAGMAMLDLLRQRDAPFAFDVTLNGFERSRSLLRLALAPPFLAATLCLAAAAALMGWRAVSHGGPKAHEERAIALGKRALADNSAALLRIARRGHRMGWGYAQLIAAEAAARIGFSRSESSETIALLDRIGARHGLTRRYSELAAEASAAETPAAMLAAARELHAWKEEIIRATR
jgi:hypothetical protein